MLKKNISDAEWEIIKILWKKPMITLKEIATSLKDSNWGYSTIRTLVNRLLEKEAIAADKTSAGSFKYYALIKEEECKAQEIKSFIARVFDGSASMLMTSLVKDGSITPKEGKKLLKLIEDMEDNQDYLDMEGGVK